MSTSRGVFFGVLAGILGASGAVFGKLAGSCCSPSTHGALSVPLRVALYTLMILVLERLIYKGMAVLCRPELSKCLGQLAGQQRGAHILRHVFERAAFSASDRAQ
jgi:hypothetical protein